MLVHFPIGLVLIAAVAEAVAMTTDLHVWRAVAVANLRAGAAFGIGAAIASLLAGNRGDVGGLRFIRIGDVPPEDDKPAAAVDGKQVVIDNFSFTPTTAAVPVGTTVTWTNHDDIPNNVVSPEQKFKSPVLDTNETFSHTFDAAGTYKYYCSIHPRMTGQVVVR